MILRIVSILFCFTSISMMASESNAEFHSAEKIYVLPEQLAITPKGIFVEFSEYWHETSALFSDEEELYSSAKSN